MNSTDLNSTNTFAAETVTRTVGTPSPAPFPKQAETTVFQAPNGPCSRAHSRMESSAPLNPPPNVQNNQIIVVTTVAPAGSDSALIAVVIILILLTVAAIAFLLYRYLCHNKGDYRTTGELAPGEDPDEDFSNQTSGEKKEYFI